MSLLSMQLILPKLRIFDIHMMSQKWKIGYPQKTFHKSWMLIKVVSSVLGV